MVCHNNQPNGPEYPITINDNGATATRQIELAKEQEYVSALYERLDLLRVRTQRQLDGVLAQGGSGGTHQNRSERDSFAGMYAERLGRLWAVENGLCFGRLDNADNTSSTSAASAWPTTSSGGC
ncbi:hypothetical protein ACFQX6_19035 [Streptosporangium lutulentum]